MTWIVNSILILLIFFIVWWFWLFKPRGKMSQQGIIEITLDNGVYKPNVIQGAVGQTLRLKFIRKDASHCADQVIFDDFNVRQTLSLEQPTEVELKLDKVGEFSFSCAMGMYRGQLIVMSSP